MKSTQDILLNFINELAPEHDRTSCSDDNLNGNQYFNECGYPRCARCALLHRLNTGEFPYGVHVSRLTIRFSGHERITEN
jgi:hypothetical protein